MFVCPFARLFALCFVSFSVVSVAFSSVVRCLRRLVLFCCVVRCVALFVVLCCALLLVAALLFSRYVVSCYVVIVVDVVVGI